MSEAAAILTELRDRGVSVRADGEILCLRPRAAVDQELLARVREAKVAILAALRRPVCDCRRLPRGEPVHRPGCPAVRELRKRPSAVWLEDPEPDAVGDAVRSLLKPGEYIDERGRIRKVQ